MVYSTLQELLNDQLSQIYAAKSHLAKALPHMIEGAYSTELQSFLRLRLQQTLHQLERLDRALKNLSVSMHGMRCQVMDAFIKKAADITDRRGNEVLLDIGLVFVMRHIENYESSFHENARTIAEVLGHKHLVKMLDENREEDEQMERSWTVLSEDMIDTVHIEGCSVSSKQSGKPESGVVV